MTTKKCKCGNTKLVCIATQQLKYCTECNTWINWYKEEGEPDYV